MPKLKNIKFDVKKLDTSFCHMVQNLFRYFESCRRRSRLYVTAVA